MATAISRAISKKSADQVVLLRPVSYLIFSGSIVLHYPPIRTGTFANNAKGIPWNFTRRGCALTGLPRIDLPDDYRTYGPLPMSVMRGGDDRENFDLYDKNVREAVPMAFTIRDSDGDIEHRVLCLAPDNVVEGSRVPQSAAAHLTTKTSLEAALAVMALMFISSSA
jgi:hypothetical protein